MSLVKPRVRLVVESVAYFIHHFWFDMAAFFRKVARATPISFGAHSKSSRTNFHIPFTAIAAISGGFSYLYYSSSPNLVAASFTFRPCVLFNRLFFVICVNIMNSVIKFVLTFCRFTQIKLEMRKLSLKISVSFLLSWNGIDVILLECDCDCFLWI